jgi:hypothetical protein
MLFELRLTLQTQSDKHHTMSNWMDAKIKKLQDAEARQQHEHELQLHKAAVLKEKGLHAFEQVQLMVRRDIEKYNKTFAKDDARKRLQFGEFSASAVNGFETKNQTYPHVTVNVMYTGNAIQANFIIAQDASVDAPRTFTELIEMTIENDDSVGYRYKGQVIMMDDISHILLDRMLPSTD